MIELILGGARSGKSSLAEQLAFDAAKEDVIYIATATAVDDEMRARIAKHQQDRPAQWQVVESPLALCETIANYGQTHTLLVDCLTLWLNNCLFDNPKQNFPKLFETLIHQAKKAKHVIFVANEVGLGIIPMGEVTRAFVDEAGRLNQALAKQADRVVFVVAGIPQVLKGEPL